MVQNQMTPTYATYAPQVAPQVAGGLPQVAPQAASLEEYQQVVASQAQAAQVAQAAANSAAAAQQQALAAGMQTVGPQVGQVNVANVAMSVAMSQKSESTTPAGAIYTTTPVTANTAADQQTVRGIIYMYDDDMKNIGAI